MNTESIFVWILSLVNLGIIGLAGWFTYESIWDKVHFNPVEGFNLHSELAWRYRPQTNKDLRLLAGVTPLDAVQAQLVIMYLVLGSVAVTTSSSTT